MEPGSGTFDREIDAQPRQTLPGPIEGVDGYQRLIANPFLTVLAWLVGYAIIREGARRQVLALFMTGIVSMFLAFLLLQFHCLDCGGTGWLLRAWRHACPAVVARREYRRARRFHGPGLKVQLASWFVLIVAGLVLGMVALRSRR